MMSLPQLKSGIVLVSEQSDYYSKIQTGYLHKFYVSDDNILICFSKL
jgi:hypothetical protein